MAYLIHPNGNIEELEPRNGKVFELDELQAAVSGRVSSIQPQQLIQRKFVAIDPRIEEPTPKQAVDVTPQTYMIINNDGGNFNKLPYNEIATQLYRYGAGESIVGKAVLCLRGELLSRSASFLAGNKAVPINE